MKKMENEKNVDINAGTVFAVCCVFDVPISRDELKNMFRLSEAEVDRILDHGRKRGLIRESWDQKFVFLGFEKENDEDYSSDEVSYAIYNHISNEKFQWTIVEMERLAGEEILSGDSYEEVVNITRKMAKKAEAEYKFELVEKLYKTNIDFCYKTNLDRTTVVKCIIDLARTQYNHAVTPKDTFDLLMKEYDRIVLEQATPYDAVLMEYTGLWMHHRTDEKKGAQIRTKGLELMQNFDNKECEAEFNIVKPHHYSLIGQIGKTISAYEADITDLEKNKTIEVNAYFFLPVLFAYMNNNESSKAQVAAEILYNRVKKINDTSAMTMILGTFGRTLICTGSYERGKECLYKAYEDACAIKHGWGQAYAVLGLAQYYLKTENPQGCAEVIAKYIEVCHQFGYRPMLGSTFVIDALEYLEKNGCKIDGFRYRDVVEKMLTSTHLRVCGGCWMHKAKILISDGANNSEIINAFATSIRILRTAEAKTDLIASYIEYAKFLLDIGNRDAATLNAKLARRLLGGEEAREIFPVSLYNLLGNESGEEDSLFHLESLAMELRNIVNRDMLIARIITSLERHIRAERAALITKEKDKLQLVFADGYMNIEEDDETYQNIMLMASYFFEKEKTVCISKKNKYRNSNEQIDTTNPTLTVGIPFKKDGETKAMVYLESFIRRDELSKKETAAIDHFSDLVSEHIVSVIIDSQKSYADVENVENVDEINTNYFRSSERSYEEIYRKIDKVSKTNVPILITGETGVGKEVIAKEVFNKGNYRKNFVKVNCGAIPETLIESELFGYEKGSFTGANQQKKGYFEAAEGGTVFLDEIGELPLSAQVKLLRVLQEHEIIRVGGTNVVPVDFKLIAATNKNLEEEVAKGTFREDLYYRLNIIQLEIPPLRNRKADLTQMTKFFIRKFEKEIGETGMYLSDDSLMWLLNYSWPGNVRELENTLHRAVLLSEKKEITLNGSDKKPAKVQKVETLEEVERNYILKVLDMCDGKVSGPNGAAELLGLKRTTLQAKMEKLGIKKN